MKGPHSQETLEKMRLAHNESAKLKNKEIAQEFWNNPKNKENQDKVRAILNSINRKDPILRAKLSETRKEQWADSTYKEKMKIAHEQGRTHSPEAHAKTGKARKEYNRTHPKEEEARLRKLRNIGGHRTSIELLVAKELDSLKILFNQQERIGKYFVDFLITDTNLILEAQGCFFHRCAECGHFGYNSHEVHLKDSLRKRNLESLGYKVVWLWEHDIKANVKECVLSAVKVAA